MSRWLSLLLAGCCGFSLDLAAAAARADAAECNTAYVETQQRRRAGELRAARLAALRCAQDACSVTVRRHCGEWLEDLDEAMPSIVIDARDAAGNELADVRAFVDDELLTEHLNGHALPIDPGEHELRFEHADAVQTRRLLVLEGHAYRRVSVRFEPARAEPTPPLAASPRAPALAPPEPLALARPIPLSSLWLAGIGAASLSAFAVLATSAYLDERELRSECGRACDAERVDALRDRYLMADVALGAGVASLAVAGAIWAFAPGASPPGAKKPDLQLDWRATGVGISGSF